MLLNDSHLRLNSLWVSDLLRWYDANKRNFPWRKEISTYHTWICEVMSQQTTMAVVVPRFLSFIDALPDVQSLATAPDELLRELWAGLGYYARARNLRAGAQFIVSRLNERFPETYEDWLLVPGVGPYTASVISSICFSVPKACVDGNVIRVVARLTSCSSGQLWSEDGRNAIQNLVDDKIDHSRPGDFNQAMMELGATVCQKRSPDCHICPLKTNCLAYSEATTTICPPNKPRKEFVAVELFAVRIFLSAKGSGGDQVLLVERKQGFLSGTVGFPLLKKALLTSPEQIEKNLISCELKGVVSLSEKSISHTITNHKIDVTVVTIQLNEFVSKDSFDVRTAEKFLKTLQVSAANTYWVSKSHAQKRLASSLDIKIWEKFS